MRWRSFVAIGDSFTEGLDDPYPDALSYRGWADLVAGQLAAIAAAEHSGLGAAAAGPNVVPVRTVVPPTAPSVSAVPGVVPAVTAVPAAADGFAYANLAIRGKLFEGVVAEQIEPTLAMRPDLISFAAGGNDVLRPQFDPPTLLAKLDAVVGQLRATGADVILFRFADVTKRLPARRVVLPRVEVLNGAIVETAERHGAYLIDLWLDEGFDNPLMWGMDRLHLSAAGHQRVAANVLATLGVTPAPEWLAVPAAPAPQPWLAARGADLQWAGAYLAPWIRRRLTGRSSGDAITAKRPSLAPFTG